MNDLGTTDYLIAEDPIFFGNPMQARQLATSLAQFAAAQRISGTGSWEMCVETGELVCSTQALKLLGNKLGKPSLDSLLALLPEDDRVRLLKAYSEALAASGCIEIEHGLIEADGNQPQLRQRFQRSEDTPEGGRRLIGTIQDLRTHQAASHALRDSERRRLLLTHAPHAIALLDGDGNFIELNPALCELLGYARDELIGCSFRAITHPDDLPACELYLATIRSGERSHLRYEKRYRRKDGAIVWAAVALSAENGDDDQASLLVAHIQDLTRRKEEEAEIRRQVYIDPLTGLPNRRMFMDRLEMIWNQAQRHSRPFAVIYLDLDDFKPINDRLGHAAGDALLIEVARRLIDCTRASDTVARIGGDEFVVLLGEVSEPGSPANVAEKILQALAAPVDACGHILAPRASLGIVSFPMHSFGSPTAMLHAADSAMYAAKRNGGGHYQLGHHPPHNVAAASRSAALG